MEETDPKRKKKMEETAATALSVPEDHVREILLRVEDTAALFRCAVTCRRWRRLVADSSFLRQRWPDTYSSIFLAGYLSWEQTTSAEATTATTTFIPTPRPPSVFGRSRRSLGSLFPGDACLLDNAVPLTARRGLLLVRLASDGIHHADQDDDEPTVRLVVCNLLAGACEVLPPLSGQVDFSKSGYAILTSADCSSSTEEQLSSPPPGHLSTLSKVIIIGMTHHGQPPNLYTFSASEARWTAPRKLTFDTAKKTTGIGGSLRHTDAALVCRGTAHWLVGKWSSHSSKCYTLAVDTETRIAAPTNYYPYDEPTLRVTADGRLSALFLKRPGLNLEVYMRQDGEKSEDAPDWWVYNDIIKLKKPEQIERIETQIAMIMLGQKGRIALLRDSQFDVYTADLKTGAMDEVTESLFPIRERIVLLEMDWWALFAHRLGSW